MPESHPVKIDSDGHVHTKYCHHATGEMAEYVESAIRAGLSEIIFLEHMEEGVDYFESTWLTEDDFDTYFKEGLFLKKKFADKIKVSLGVEVGYSPTHQDELLKRLSRRQWDRIGLSYHFMPHPEGKNHLNLLSRKSANSKAIAELGCEQVIRDYFTTLLEAIKIIPADILCHLDAPLRNQPDFTIDERFSSQINDILRATKRKGMALEINTSGYRYRGIPFPAPFILKEAAALDITLKAGSDAHSPKDVGYRFKHIC